MSLNKIPAPRAIALPKPQFPDKIEITDYNDILIPDGTAPHSVVEPTVAYAERLGARLGRLLFERDLVPFYISLGLFFGLIRVRLGAPENLVSVRRPPHAEDRLVPAVDELLDNEKELEAKAPSDMESIDCAEIREDRGRLLDVRRLAAVLTPLSDGLEALAANLENRLDVPLRTVGNNLGALFSRNQTLRQTTRAWQSYLFGDSEVAQATRRDNERLIEKTEQETEARLKAEAAEAEAARKLAAAEATTLATVLPPTAGKAAPPAPSVRRGR